MILLSEAVWRQSSYRSPVQTVEVLEIHLEKSLTSGARGLPT